MQHIKKTFPDRPVCLLDGFIVVLPLKGRDPSNNFDYPLISQYSEPCLIEIDPKVLPQCIQFTDSSQTDKQVNSQITCEYKSWHKLTADVSLAAGL